MRKYILFLLAFAVVISLLPACSDQNPTTPQPTQCVIVIGDKLDDEDGSWSPDYLVALDQVVTSNTTVHKLGVKLDNTANFILAVYDDNAGAPGAVLAQTAPQSGAAGWNEAAVTTTASLTGGSKYWVVVITDVGAVASNDTSGEVQYLSYSYSTAASSGMPGSQAGWSNFGGRTKVYAKSCQ